MNDPPHRNADPSVERDARDQLLLRLLPFSHGNWGHTNLNRISLFGRNLEKATSTGLHTRFREVLTQYLDIVHPSLEKICQQSRSAGSDPDAAGVLRAHGEALAKVAQGLTLEPPAGIDEFRRLELTIPQHVDEILRVIQALRERVLRLCQCRPSKVLEDILAERNKADSARGIVLAARLTDGEDRVIMLEQQFANVIRALLDGIIGSGDVVGAKQITLKDRTSEGRWLLEVHDSNFYVPLHMWRKVFGESGLPGRTSLTEIPAILGRYDGDICIKESTAELGTTILLRLRVLNP